MQRRNSLASLVLLFALLAGCTADDTRLLELEDGQPPVTQAPTQAPPATIAPPGDDAAQPEATPEPTSAVAEPPPDAATTAAIPAAPVVVHGAGQKTSYSGEASCTAPVQALTLTVNPDGAAQLAVIAPGFVDHYNCTQAASAEGWYMEGTADPAAQTVTFATCNMGNFAAEGAVSYAGGALSGEVVCLYSKGSAAGTRAIAVTMP